jgi:hypothetical protein
MMAPPCRRVHCALDAAGRCILCGDEWVAVSEEDVPDWLRGHLKFEDNVWKKLGVNGELYRYYD